MEAQKLIDLNEAKKKLLAVKEWFAGSLPSEQDKLCQAVVDMCIKELDKIKPVEVVHRKNGEKKEVF